MSTWVTCWCVYDVVNDECVPVSNNCGAPSGQHKTELVNIFFFKCKSLKVLCGQPVILLCVNILFPGQNKQWLSKHVISCMGLIWVYCVSVWMVKNKNTLNWASLYKKRSQGKSFSSLKVEFICDDTALAWGNPVTGSVWVIQNKGTGLLCIGDYIEIVPHECNMCCLSFSFDSHTEANCKGSAALCWLLV